MPTSTIERRDRRTETVPTAGWTCDNCGGATLTVRRRCADCGTSRS